MNFRILKIITLFLFLSNCGYTPIYMNQKDVGIDINLISFEGEKDINLSIAKKLSRYQSENAEKVYKVKVISQFNKNSLTRDEAGDTTAFRLVLNVDFVVDIDESSKTINFLEKFDVKKDDSLFEQNKYEKTVKKDMIDLIVRKFISQLLTMQ